MRDSGIVVEREILACHALEDSYDAELHPRHAAPIRSTDSEGDMDLGIGQPTVVPDCDLPGKHVFGSLHFYEI